MALQWPLQAASSLSDVQSAVQPPETSIWHARQLEHQAIGDVDADGKAGVLGNGVRRIVVAVVVLQDDTRHSLQRLPTARGGVHPRPDSDKDRAIRPQRGYRWGADAVERIRLVMEGVAYPEGTERNPLGEGRTRSSGISLAISSPLSHASSTPCRDASRKPYFRGRRLGRPGALSRVGTPSPRKTGRSRPSWSASWPSQDDRG